MATECLLFEPAFSSGNSVLLLSRTCTGTHSAIHLDRFIVTDCWQTRLTTDSQNTNALSKRVALLHLVLLRCPVCVFALNMVCTKREDWLDICAALRWTYHTFPNETKCPFVLAYIRGLMIRFPNSQPTSYKWPKITWLRYFKCRISLFWTTHRNYSCGGRNDESQIPPRW